MDQCTTLAPGPPAGALRALPKVATFTSCACTLRCNIPLTHYCLSIQIVDDHLVLGSLETNVISCFQALHFSFTFHCG